MTRTRIALLLSLLLMALILFAVPRVFPVLQAQTTASETAVRATLLFQPQHDPAVRAANVSEAALDRFRATQVGLLKSDQVLRAVASMPEIETLPVLKQSDGPVDWIRRRLRIELEGDLAYVSLAAGNPSEQAMIVNAVVDQYLDHCVNAEVFKRVGESEKVQAYYDRLVKVLREKRTELRHLFRAAGIDDLTETTRRAAEARWNAEIEEIRTRLRELRLARAGAEARMKRLGERAAEDEDAKRSAVDLGDEIEALRAQEQLLGDELKSAHEEQRSESREVTGDRVELEARAVEIEYIKSALGKVAERLYQLKGELEGPPAVSLSSKAAPR
jgi:hypothetical protein